MGFGMGVILRPKSGFYNQEGCLPMYGVWVAGWYRYNIEDPAITQLSPC